MNKILALFLLLGTATISFGQTIGRVDPKTKEFSVAPNQTGEYHVFGYQYANVTTKKMICFSSRIADVKDNFNGCPLGAYYDTQKMKIGDKIIYLGNVGPFAKMEYQSAAGKKTQFYLQKTTFVIK